jgi:hypothetical protein
MSTSYSLAKAQSCQTINQNLVLLFVFSFSFFLLKQHLVLLFVFSSSSSRAISFHICILLKYLAAILFVSGKSLIVLLGPVVQKLVNFNPMLALTLD